MEITNKLIDQLPRVLDPVRGVAYILFCAQNKPREVLERLKQAIATATEAAAAAATATAAPASDPPTTATATSTSTSTPTIAWAGWDAKIVSSTGNKAGWEKLCIMRIWKKAAGEAEA